MTWLKATDVAERLGVSSQVIFKWGESGYLRRGLIDPDAPSNRANPWYYDIEQAREWFETTGRSRRNIGKKYNLEPATGKLPEILAGECEEAGYDQDDATVLSKQVDPFRIGNPEHHEAGKWLRDQLAERAPGRRIHLRGLHYVLVAAGDVRKPNGEIYINTEADWLWLMSRASKWARWLGYVPFDSVIDQFNDAPVSFIPEMKERAAGLAAAPDIEIPENADDALPTPTAINFAGRQPWRIVILGEKSSLRDVLLPIAREHHAELQLFTGVNSLTAAAEIAERIVNDGRPAVVLYFADFDPAGWNMPITFARHVQAYLHLSGRPDTTILVRRVALTSAQCVDNNLPSTPLKPGERRASQWIARWGREQTEIDALAALRPEILSAIANDAVRIFYDETMPQRGRSAEEAWEDAAREAVEAHPEYETIRDLVGDALAVLQAAHADYADAVALAAVRFAEVELPEVERVEPGEECDEDEFEIGEGSVFDSREDFVVASRRLKSDKISVDEFDDKPTTPEIDLSELDL